MSELKCNIVEDLMPLYIDDLVSESTKEDIENHLNECDNCNKNYERLRQDIILDSRDINLKDGDSENLKIDTLSSIKKYLNKAKYIFIIFSIAVAVEISLRNGGLLTTIPWVIIVPFMLGILYDDYIFIMATVLFFNIVFTSALKNEFLGVWTGLYFLMSAGAGIFLASSIKNFKQR
ncbi:zf-HC2 domain-containing protein [Intestinibacter sp.]